MPEKHLPSNALDGVPMSMRAIKRQLAQEFESDFLSEPAARKNLRLAAPALRKLHKDGILRAVRKGNPLVLSSGRPSCVGKRGDTGVISNGPLFELRARVSGSLPATGRERVFLYALRPTSSCR